jgi:chromosome segregation ATPase
MSKATDEIDKSIENLHAAIRELHDAGTDLWAKVKKAEEERDEAKASANAFATKLRIVENDRAAFVQKIAELEKTVAAQKVIIAGFVKPEPATAK